MAKSRVNTPSADAAGSDGGLPLQATAARAGVSPATVRRWAAEGLIPRYAGDGSWSPRAVSPARLVARLRERGHSREEIRQTTREGRLAFGYIEELFPQVNDRTYTARQAAKVLVTRPVVDRAGVHLELERIAELRLKGFTVWTDVFLARQAQE